MAMAKLFSVAADDVRPSEGAVLTISPFSSFLTNIADEILPSLAAPRVKTGHVMNRLIPEVHAH